MTSGEHIESLSRVGSLDRDYCYKSGAIQIPNDTVLAPIPSRVENFSPTSTNSEQYTLNSVTTEPGLFMSILHKINYMAY
jgi:hypothetical protein